MRESDSTTTQSAFCRSHKREEEESSARVRAAGPLARMRSEPLTIFHLHRTAPLRMGLLKRRMESHREEHISRLKDREDGASHPSLRYSAVRECSLLPISCATNIASVVLTQSLGGQQ